MADIQEAIRRLTIEATARGVSETSALLKRMVETQNEVTVSSEKSERATQTMERRLESIQRRYDDEYRKRRELLKLEKDLDAARAQGLLTSQRQSELIALAATRLNMGTNANGLYARSLAAAEAQANGLASRLGPMGTLLASIGPSGLVAAAGLGAAAFAAYKLVDASNTFARDMLQLRDVSQTLGLTTTQFQAIADEGSKFALSEERIGQVLQRFTAQMEEFRRGQGELFALVQRIDPALAREMASARDTATAIDYLARVYEKAGDARQKLDRAIGGRNGGTVGLLFEDVGRQGGVNLVAKEFEKSGDAIDRHMIEKIARLKAEIDDMAGDAQRNFASIFSLQVLESQHRFYENWRDISRIAKEFSVSSDWDKFIADLTSNKLVAAFSMIQGLAIIMPQMLGRGLAGPQGSGAQSVDESGFLGLGPTPLPGARPNAAIDRSALELEINLEKQRIGALGSAATATERLAQRKRELALAVKDNVISQQDYNRALGMAGLETVMQLEARRIGLLGEMALVDDIVAQKQREVNLARAQGVRITQAESAAILERTRLMAEYAKLEGPRGKLQFERDQIGRTDVDATVAARLRSEGLPIDLNSATAAEIRFNETLRESKALLIETGSGALRTFRSELSQTGNAWDALGRTALKTLDAIAMKLADKAIENAITGMFSGLGRGGAAAVAAGGARGGLLGGFLIPGFLEQGGIVGPGMTMAGRYVHPAYFDDAPHYNKGGIVGAGPDAFPIIAHRDEEVIRRDDPRHRWNGGTTAPGGQPVVLNYNDNRVFNDTSPQVAAMLIARDRQEWPKKKAEILRDLRKGRGSDPNFYSP